MLLKKTYHILFLILMASKVMSQGFVVSTSPPLNGGNGSGAVVFTVTASAPVIIDSIAGTLYQASLQSGPIQVWTKPGLMTGPPTVDAANGWTLHGTATMTPLNTGTTNLQQQVIPINIGQVLLPGNSLCIAYGVPAGQSVPNVAYTTYVAANQSIFSNSQLSLRTDPGFGYGLTFPNPSLDRQFNGSLYYRIAQSGVNNAGAISLNVPAECPGNQLVSFTVGNFGTNSINALTIGWEINGIPQTPIAYNALIDTVGSINGYQATIPLGNINLISGQNITVKAWTYNPNGQTDPVQANDTLQVVFTPRLSGAYTLNPLLSTGGSNFQTLTDMANALNNIGVCGPVVITAQAGSTFNEQVVLQNIVGASAINTINIIGNGANISFAPTSSDRYVIQMNNSSYVTWEQFNIIGSDPNFGYGVLFTNDCKYDTIRNCTIDLSAITSTTAASSGGIIASGSVLNNTTSGLTCSFCGIDGNTITGTGSSTGPVYGIRLNGIGFDGIKGTRIANNVIRDIRQYGIFISAGDSVWLDNNDISRPSLTSTTTFYGIYTQSGTANLRITRNKIHTLQGQVNSSSTVYGMFLSGGSGASAPSLIANNLLYNFNTIGILYGIYLSTPDNHRILHNSIIFDDQVTTSGSASYALFSTGSGIGSDFMNNQIFITRNGNGPKYGMYLSSGATFQSCDFNNVFINAPGQTFFGFLNTNQQTQLAFQTASGGNYQNNGIVLNPLFLNPSLQNYTPTAGSHVSSGTGLSTQVPFDINGIPRSLFPTPGAFEGLAALNDAGVVQYISPGNVVCGGSDSVWVRIRNYGSQNLNTLAISYSVNGQIQNTLNLQGLNLAQGSDSLIFLGIYSYTGNGPFVFNTFVSLPNGQQDPNVLNDSLQLSISAGLAGTYTLDPQLPASATNYTSLQAFANALTQFGICSSVDLFVAPGIILSEQVTFGSIPGTSLLSQVRIHGMGATVQTAPNANNRFIIQLNGTRFLTIDSLNVKSLSNLYGFGYHITNGASNDTIRFCHIDLTSITGTSSVNTGGVVFSAASNSPTTAGNTGSRCGILNNTIEGSSTGGPYYGIIMIGASDGTGALANTIAGNTIRDFYYAGIYVSGADSMRITHNDISRPTISLLSTFYGLFFTGATKSGIVNRNRISHPHGADPLNTSGFYGVYSTVTQAPSDTLVFSNNLMHNIHSNGVQYGFYMITAPQVQILHNTLVFDFAGTTSNSATYGIYLTGNASGARVLNNIVYATRSGSGSLYGIFYTSSAINMASSNNNVIYINSPTASSFYGYYNTSAQLTRQAFVQASGGVFESQSFSLDPVFVSMLNQNFQPTNPAIDNTGTNLITLVSDDFFGLARTATPDPGAIEFSVLGLDAGVTSFVSPSGFVCPGNGQVIVKIRNYGSTNLNTVVLNWSVNGQVQSSLNLTGLNLTSGQETQATLGTYPFVQGQNYTISAWTSNPNGGVDQAAINDTLSLNLQSGMLGTYTVDANLPVSATNYLALQDAVTDLLGKGVCGAVTIDIVNPNENAQYNITQIQGVSASNTVTIRSQAQDSSAVRLFFTPTSTLNNYVFRFTNTSWLILEHLTLHNPSTGVGRVLDFNGNNTNNIVRSCILLGDTVTPGSSNNKAIVFSNNNTPGDNQNLFENNLILGGAYGIFWYSGSNQVYENGNRFNKNVFRKQGTFTGDFRFQNNLQVTSNRVLFQSTVFSQTYGFWFGTTGNGLICDGNYIKGFGDHPTQSIRLEGSNGSNAFPARISNNMLISGDQTSINSLFQIYLSNSANVRVFHNSASLFNSANGSANMFASQTPSLQLLNNNFSNSSGNHVGYFSTTGMPAISNHNNFFSGTATLMFVDLVPTLDLAAWQAASNADALSFSVDPNFFSNTDLGTCSPTLNNAGTPIPTVVFDIDGFQRSMQTPDIGATEFQGNSQINFGPDPVICPGTSIVLGYPLPGVTAYTWSTGATSPSIQVSSPGTYTLNTLGGCNSASATIVVSTVVPPIAAFNSTTLDPQVQFTSLATGTAIAHNWNFGNGSTSTLPNPIHTYNANGSYNVSLTVTDSCGQTNTTNQTIVIGNATGINESNPWTLTIGPNPTAGKVYLDFQNLSGEYYLELHDMSGRVLNHWKDIQPQLILSLENYASGVYLLRCNMNFQERIFRIIKQ